MEIVPNKLFAAFNITYAPSFSRINGTWQQENPVEISTAAASGISSNIFVGAEIRHLTRNQVGFFTDHALFVGPSVFFKLSDTLTFKTAWSIQIPDETTNRLDTAVDRHQVRMLLVKSY